MVIGAGGAGKSTFARALAGATGLPLIHLDRHYWRPGWVPTPAEEWAACVRRLSAGDAWIMDGNYGDTLSLRLERCDAVVFFDLAPLVCLWGIFRRWLLHQFERRPDLPDGCGEVIDLAFVRWVWDFPRRSRPRILAALREARPDVAILIIRRRREARGVLEAICTGGARPTA
jgi:adenylate kinase family enzyme